MTRKTTCSDETRSWHVASPGLVKDDERVCRAGFDPMHYEKGRLSKPKRSLIRQQDLIDNSLSVWRLLDEEEDTVDEALVQLFAAPSGQKVGSIYGPSAGAIRRISLPGLDQVFCVIDDCLTDEDGSYHRLHAGVKICESISFEGDIIKENESFILARNQLWQLFITSSSESLTDRGHQVIDKVA